MLNTPAAGTMAVAQSEMNARSMLPSCRPFAISTSLPSAESGYCWMVILLLVRFATSSAKTVAPALNCDCVG